MTVYLTSESQIAPYMAFPKFLMNMDISDSARLTYMLLLDRARISMRNAEWIDDAGRVFVSYPIAALADALGRSESTIKDCLKSLEDHDLIVRDRQGMGRSNHIYLKLPAQTAGFSAIRQTGSRLSDSRNSGSVTDRNPAANKNNRYKTKNQNTAFGNNDQIHYSQRRYECKEDESL